MSHINDFPCRKFSGKGNPLNFTSRNFISFLTVRSVSYGEANHFYAVTQSNQLSQPVLLFLLYQLINTLKLNSFIKTCFINLKSIFMDIDNFSKGE